MKWFWYHDMHSGGDLKTQYYHIYIQAESEELANRIFYARFDRNPNCVTCTCCGPDYAVSVHDTLEEATEYNRSKYGQGYEKIDEVPLDVYLETVSRIIAIPHGEVSPADSVPVQGYVWHET